MVAEISMLGVALKEVLTSGVADKAVGLVSSVKKNLDKDKTISAYEMPLHSSFKKIMN